MYIMAKYICVNIYIYVFSVMVKCHTSDGRNTQICYLMKSYYANVRF